MLFFLSFSQGKSLLWRFSFPYFLRSFPIDIQSEDNPNKVYYIINNLARVIDETEYLSFALYMVSCLAMRLSNGNVPIRIGKTRAFWQRIIRIWQLLNMRFWMILFSACVLRKKEKIDECFLLFVSPLCSFIQRWLMKLFFNRRRKKARKLSLEFCSRQQFPYSRCQK